MACLTSTYNTGTYCTHYLVLQVYVSVSFCAVYFMFYLRERARHNEAKRSSRRNFANAESSPMNAQMKC